MLSRRRLIFTDHEVYYECNAMFCYESLCLDLVQLHEVGSHWFRDFLTPGPLDGRRHFNPIHKENLHVRKGVSGTQFSHLTILKDCISQYSARELSYNSDKLDAFRGILNSHGFPTYYGLPVFDQPHCGRGFKVYLPTRSVTVNQDGLENILCAWTHTNDNSLTTGAVSTHVPIQRIAQFPSWSWAGWTGMVQFNHWGDFSPGIRTPIDFHLGYGFS